MSLRTASQVVPTANFVDKTFTTRNGDSTLLLSFPLGTPITFKVLIDQTSRKNIGGWTGMLPNPYPLKVWMTRRANTEDVADLTEDTYACTHESVTSITITNEHIEQEMMLTFPEINERGRHTLSLRGGLAFTGSIPLPSKEDQKLLEFYVGMEEVGAVTFSAVDLATLKPTEKPIVEIQQTRPVYYMGDSLDFTVTGRIPGDDLNGGYVRVVPVGQFPSKSLKDCYDPQQNGRFPPASASAATAAAAAAAGANETKQEEVAVSAGRFEFSAQSLADVDTSKLLHRDVSEPNEKLLYALRLDYQRYECDRVLDVLVSNVLDEEDIETLRAHKMKVYKDCKKALFHGADIMNFVGKGGGFVAGIGYTVIYRLNGLVGRLAWGATTGIARGVARCVGSDVFSPTNLAAKAYRSAKLVSPECAWMAAVWTARKVGCRDPTELAQAARNGILQGGGTEPEALMAVFLAMQPLGQDILQQDYFSAAQKFEGRARELAGLDPPPAREIPLDSTFVKNACIDACRDEYKGARDTTEKAMSGGSGAADAINARFGLEEAKEQTVLEEEEQLYELWCCGKSSGGKDFLGRVKNGNEVYLSRSAPFYLRHAENRPSEMVAEVAGGETRETKVTQYDGLHHVPEEAYNKKYYSLEK